MKLLLAITLALSVALSQSKELTIAFSHVGQSVKSAFDVEGKRGDNCDPSDCEITRHDGVQILVYGNYITRQRYSRKRVGDRLPFELFFARGAKDALQKIKRSVGVTLSYVSEGRYEGIVQLEDGTPAVLYFQIGSQGLVDEVGVTLGETG